MEMLEGVSSFCSHSFCIECGTLRWTELEEAHLVTALHRLSKSRDGPGLLGHSVLKRVTAALHRRAQQSCAEANAPGGNLRSMTPRHLANTVWALTRLSANEPPLIKESMEPDALRDRASGELCVVFS